MAIIIVNLDNSHPIQTSPLCIDVFHGNFKS